MIIKVVICEVENWEKLFKGEGEERKVRNFFKIGREKLCLDCMYYILDFRKKREMIGINLVVI